MNPTKVDRNQLNELTDLPNVGPAMAADLVLMGIDEPDQLRGRDPLDLYQTLCKLTGARHDPCVLDTFIAITRFMTGEDPKPWWHYSSERKAKYPGL